MEGTILRVDVGYRLGEYLSIVTDYLPHLLPTQDHSKPKRGGSQRELGPSARVLVRCVGSIAFAYKRLKVGECHFEFSSRGICRRSKDGLVRLRWEEVQRVHRLSQAYLFESEDGGMPVPYRCITERGRLALEAMLASVGHGSDKAA